MAGVGTILLLSVVMHFVFSQSKSTYRTTPVLNVEDYLDNANSLRGNTYRLEGIVQHSLAWSSSYGRLFSVEVEEGRRAVLVPLLIPSELNAVNVQRGQRFVFQLEVVENGMLRVLSMEKS